MAEQEIDSFIRKFKDLWKCGFDAHLDVDTHAGQAWVVLRVGLGVHGHHQAKIIGTSDSPCRHCRRARREVARKVKAEEANHESNELVSEENLDEKDISIMDDNMETGVVEHKENENHESESEATNKVREYPAVVVVFATAVIDDSPEKIMSQSEFNNLEKLIFRENHLKANIVKFEHGENFTREMRKNCFKHTIELRIHVSTKNLWEGARSYVWKHFGQNEWSKRNGSSVVFNRIHVKD